MADRLSAGSIAHHRMADAACASPSPGYAATGLALPFRETRYRPVRASDRTQPCIRDFMFSMSFF